MKGSGAAEGDGRGSTDIVVGGSRSVEVGAVATVRIAETMVHGSGCRVEYTVTQRWWPGQKLRSGQQYAVHESERRAGRTHEERRNVAVLGTK
jgi:hypothetical protein